MANLRDKINASIVRRPPRPLVSQAAPLSSQAALRGLHDRLLRVFALVSPALARTSLALQDRLPVLVHLELHYHNLRGVNADVNGRPIDFLTLDALNMDDKLLTIHLDDLAHLLTLVVTSHDLHFVVLADGYAATVMFLAEVLGQRRTHDLSADVGGRVKVAHSVLASRRRHQLVKLHLTLF